MNIMESVAALSTGLQAAKLAQNYAVAILKKDMDGQEQAAREILEMLPDAPPKGDVIDTYA